MRKGNYGCHLSMMYFGISLLSRGPTCTFQPLASSISPLIRDALPGMMMVLVFDFAFQA